MNKRNKLVQKRAEFQHIRFTSLNLKVGLLSKISKKRET